MELLQRRPLSETARNSDRLRRRSALENEFGRRLPGDEQPFPSAEEGFLFIRLAKSPPQAVSLFLPLALRLFNIARPPLVLIRDRKP